MEGNENINLKKKENKKKTVFNRDSLIFVFFLILSFIFWYLNSLSKEIEGDVRYPVRYINSPKDRVLTGDISSKLGLSVKGPGYSILKLKLTGNQAPVIIDFDKVNYIRMSDSNFLKFYIITDGLIETFEQQLRAEFEITEINPDTLFFIFDRLISKVVPVVPDVNVTTEKQFFVNGLISSTPSTVEISGPQHVIDTMQALKTKAYKFVQLNRSTSKSVALPVSDLYETDVKRVIVKVPVEQFTEASIDIRVRLVNLPDSLDIKLFPDAVSVKYLVGVSDYKTIEEIPIEAVIDLAEYDLGEVNKLPVTIQNIPPFISSLRYAPQKVDFIVEKKKK